MFRRDSKLIVLLVDLIRLFLCSLALKLLLFACFAVLQYQWP